MLPVSATCRFWQKCRTKFRPFNKVETNCSRIPLGIRIAENLSIIGLNHKNSTLRTVPSVPPWLLRRPCFNYDVHAFDRNSVSAEVLQNHFAETKNGFGKHVEIYTDGSKIGESVACAVICGNQINSMHLPDKSSVYTAELFAIRMALELIHRLKQKSFVINSDSLSSLQAILSVDIINVTVFNILKLYTQLTDMGKHVSLCWIPSHVGIKGNEMADKSVFVLSSLKARFPQRASFRIYPSYVRKNGRIHEIAPRQINCFQSNQYLAKTNSVHHYAVVTKQSSLG